MQSTPKSFFATRGKSRLVILFARSVLFNDHSASEILKGSMLLCVEEAIRSIGSAVTPRAAAPTLIKVLRFMRVFGFVSSCGIEFPGESQRFLLGVNGYAGKADLGFATSALKS